MSVCCRNGVAKLLLTVASPLEELIIECCQDILTDITFIAMSRLPNLTVRPSLPLVNGQKKFENPHCWNGFAQEP